MKYCRKVKDEQVITIQSAVQLKARNTNVLPVQLFSGQCKANFFLETGIHPIDDEDNIS